MCLGENVIEISSDKVEGSREWDSPEIQDTANSGQLKKAKAMVFHQMDTEEVSDRFVAPCFVNGIEVYDGEINLGEEDNMISKEYAVKLCLEHEVKRGNKVVKKELIVALKGEIYFVKFIINPDEDDVEPAGTITIYPDFDPFLEETEDEGKDMYDWDQLLDFNLDDIQLLGEEELPQFVCKMGKSNRNKKKSMDNLSLFYQDIGTSSSTGGHLTQEEAAKEALAIRMSQKFALLEEVRPVIETLAYHDKYKKILDEIWKDKIELDGKSMKEEEEVVKRIKGEALKEEDDPGAFIFPIRLEGQVNENALADTGSDINTMPYKIYEQLGREEMKKVDRGITMINHTQAEVMGILTNVLCQVGVTTLIAKFLILDIPIDRDAPIVIDRGFLQVMRNTESDSDDEEDYQIQRNKFVAPIYGPKPAPYLNLPLKHVNWKSDYKGSYTKEEEAIGQWRTEIRLTDPYGNIYIQGFTTKKTD
ncbi:agenet domain-containing protein [Tanacetum coccineum]